MACFSCVLTSYPTPSLKPNKLLLIKHQKRIFYKKKKSMKEFSIINDSLTIHQSFKHLIMQYKCFGNISITNIVLCINITAICEDICVVLMLSCYQVLIYWVQLFVDLKVPFVTAVHCSALICAYTQYRTRPRNQSLPWASDSPLLGRAVLYIWLLCCYKR